MARPNSPSAGVARIVRAHARVTPRSSGTGGSHGTAARRRYSPHVRRIGWLVLVVFHGAAVLCGCGARTATLDDPPEERELPEPRPEICNGLDDDLDGLRVSGVFDAGADASLIDGGRADGGLDADLFVDEDFRDEDGRYLHPDHCGGCDKPCRPSGEALAVTCALVEEAPTCVALECAPGFAISTTGRCIPIDRLCLPCADDGDCGDLAAARCALVAGERRCTVDCELGCPEGYACDAGSCVPEGGSCSCDPGDRFTLACALIDPAGERCPGSAVCDDGVISECEAPPEVCDEVDNDCDGQVDEGYRDARGAYILDIHNCGECGVDCTLSTAPEGDLVCGGDPFAPSCVLACPDAADGIMPGDRIDADLDIANGCECTVGALDDVPGPVRTSGEMLDVNCDGADGIVVESFYVAPDGDDDGPGSPTRPLRTIQVGLDRAAASIGMPNARPHVFIASGTYAETLELPDGVFVHGGYRRDFLALDPDGFRTVVRAPVDTTAPGGAALVIRGAGASPTSVEWVELRGLDATAAGAATFGVYALDPGGALSLRDLTVRAGVPSDGMPGTLGAAGADFMSPPGDGAPPRAAVEDASNVCVRGPRNTVMGGAGGRNVCGGVDVSGGTGGAPGCPSFTSFQPSGQAGRSAGATAGGTGGRGGQDSQGPIDERGEPRRSCFEPSQVCCGLADFTVPTDFQGPRAGEPGRAGRPGAAGRGCRDAFGAFDGDTWRGDAATGGTDGTPGSGGGGGGAGGGAEIDWIARDCEFADGLGGGGGGGGAGGCGGEPGMPGTSGAPSVAILFRFTRAPARLPEVRGVILAPSDGGRGGDGGAGGAGGRGSSGGFGGELSRTDRSTPSLAGPFPGGRGGTGGRGGDGGGGGGGCGGASVGIWVLGGRADPRVEEWRSSNTFDLGRPGIAGRGGGGAAAGGDGAEGGARDIVL